MMGLVNLREQEEKPKAIIMAGGAGVGKTFVTDKFKKAAESKGWVVLNPDQYARNPDPEQRLSLAAAASKINKEVDNLAKSKDKPNIIWDTTANNPTKVKELQDAGYDVLMIMVYAHPSVAFEQNFARAGKKGEDSLPPYVVLKTWADSYNDPHIENYQKMFDDNFIIIDNTSKPGTDNSKIDAFNKAAQQGGKALEKHIGDIIGSDPEYYSSTQMVSKPANLSKDQQDDFDSKAQQLGLKLEEDDREAMEKLYQKYFEKNNEVMPLKKVGRKNGMEEVYKSYMSKKVKKDAEKSKVYNDISASIKNIGKSFLSIDDATSKAMKHIGQKKINELTQFLVDSILNEEYKEVVALFGGGFKPPTKGHLEVILQGLKLAPEVNKLKIIVGGGVRGGITQKQSKEIWEIYDDANLIPISNVEIIEASPFKYLKDYLKNHPDDKTYVFIGSRDGNDDDKFDVEQRSKYVKNYSDNVFPLEVSTGGSISGTEARKLLKTDLDGFRNMLPANLTQGEVDKIVDILNNKSTDSTPKPTSNKTEPLTPKEENIDPKSQKKHKGKSAPFGSAYEPLNENATYSSKIDYKQQIKDLTKHMIKKGMNILPLPKVIFKHGDQENASQFLGKTAYYSPSDMTVVLYTEGRHPKDIARSFAHEMIHHIQNIEDRLENINTTNTTEDDNLNDIEREAYTKGNMTFRNWTDSLDGEEVTSLNEKIVGEKIECDNCGWSWNIVDGGDDLYICHKCDHDNEPENGDPFGLKAYARELMEDFNIEDIKPPTKSLEEQERVRIFTTNCGCDKT
jgi:predicted ABC-type ATPase